MINGCSELILELLGTQVDAHACSAGGLAALPFDIALEIEAELERVA